MFWRTHTEQENYNLQFWEVVCRGGWDHSPPVLGAPIHVSSSWWWNRGRTAWLSHSG
uniref:Uncharacterized protein n=1 Tax=Anguilla anguilla TaxID=7936 RepID=A0A0E9TIH2_ANGAN